MSLSEARPPDPETLNELLHHLEAAEASLRAAALAPARDSLAAALALARRLASPHGPQDEPPNPTGNPAPLTLRELEVLALLARGATNREIAAALVITERTVKFHMTNILAALGARSRTEALIQAARRGLIDR